jgi:hypothetical protein
MSDMKSLRLEAKMKGLKNYSRLNKSQLQDLLELDDNGKNIPAIHLTARRFREQANRPIKKKPKLPPKIRSQLARIAKKRGLTGYGKMTRDQLEELIYMDETEGVPEQYMTQKRLKESRGPIPLVKPDAGYYQAYNKRRTNPLAETLASPPRSSKIRPSLRSGQRELPRGLPPKPSMRAPRVTKAMVMKLLKQRKKAECSKYDNLSKKSLSELKALL